jgi:hypothetical protein
LAELEASQNYGVFQGVSKIRHVKGLSKIWPVKGYKGLSKIRPDKFNFNEAGQTGLMGISTRTYKTGLMGDDTILGKGKGCKTSNDRYIKVNYPFKKLDQRPGTLSRLCSNSIMMLVIIFLVFLEG